MSPEQRGAKGEESYRFGSGRFGLEASVDRLEDLLLRAIG
jgi:hypothetical protein